LLINELSAHLPVYLYGEAAHHAFDLLRTGARMLGTLHARSAAEALRVMCFESKVPRAEIEAPFVFAVVSAGWRGREIIRRVVELGFLAPDGGLTGLLVRPADEQRFLPEGTQALGKWSGYSTTSVECEILERASKLNASSARG
jgi:hypothetical protein